MQDGDVDPNSVAAQMSKDLQDDPLTQQAQAMPAPIAGETPDAAPVNTDAQAQ
jgi:hypothetical protein